MYIRRKFASVNIRTLVERKRALPFQSYTDIMQPLRTLATRGPVRPTSLVIRPFLPTQSVRLAHQSYGNEQSGMEQGTNLKNPKSHLEHPGPEAPASKGSDKKSSSSSSTQSSDDQEKSDQGGSPGPAIHRPKSAAEKTDPEVRKHNEEMEKRSDRSVNQLSEEDNKVDKNFWKGESLSRVQVNYLRL